MRRWRARQGGLRASVGRLELRLTPQPRLASTASLAQRFGGLVVFLALSLSFVVLATRALPAFIRAGCEAPTEVSDDPKALV